MQTKHRIYSQFGIHCVEKWKIYSHQKIFRQINLVIYFVKPLISQNFCCNFHTVHNCAAHSRVEKREILSHWKKFRQNNSLVNSLVKPLLSRNFCKKSVRQNFCNFHIVTLWKNEKFSLIKKIFRQIKFLVTYLVKPLLSRNFCQKCVRENSVIFTLLCNAQNPIHFPSNWRF